MRNGHQEATPYRWRAAARASVAAVSLALLLPQAYCDFQEGVVLEFDTCQGLTTESYDAGWKRAVPEAAATWKDAVVTSRPGASIHGTVEIPFAAMYEVNVEVAQQGSEERLRIGGAPYSVLAGGSYEGPDAPREWVYLPLGVEQLQAGPVTVELEHVGRAPDAAASAAPLAFVDYVHLRPVGLPPGKVVIAGTSVTDDTGEAATLPLSGDLLTISVLIQNNCQVALPQSHLKCSEGGEEIGRAWTEVVEPGGQTMAQIPWRAERGKHMLQLAVEPATTTEGIDVTGATATVTIRTAGVGRPGLVAELAILDAETQQPIQQRTVGEALLVRVSAQNVGDVLADTVRATIRANGEPLPPALLSLGNIAPGATADATLPWSPDVGEYTLTLELVAANFDSRFDEPLGQTTVTVAPKPFPWPIALAVAIGVSALGLAAVLLILRARRSRADGQPMAGDERTCPRCARTYAGDVKYCPDDGTALR
ncbi:MAG: hypothetical protein ACE5JM_05390 [Armatimonadota bacterium]